MRARTAAEVQSILRLERQDVPFVLFRDGADALQLFALETARPMVSIGRHESCDIALSWDASVSRVHAVLEWLASTWTLTDDGLSTNGTHLNDSRLTTRRRLRNGDSFRVGATMLAFRDPSEAQSGETVQERPVLSVALTPQQHTVLVELCRPVLAEGHGYGAPATNAEIAATLFLAVESVKTHMRGLFDRFGIADLPQNQKRAKLVETALRAGIVTERDIT